MVSEDRFALAVSPLCAARIRWPEGALQAGVLPQHWRILRRRKRAEEAMKAFGYSPSVLRASRAWRVLVPMAKFGRSASGEDFAAVWPSWLRMCQGP